MTVELLLAQRRVVQARVASDGDGRFEAAALVPGAYALTARARGRAPRRRAVWLECGRNELEPLQLRPAAALQGRVQRADDGAPVPGALVRLTPLEVGAPTVRRADRRGAFRGDDLAAGRYELEVHAPGFARTRQLVVAPRRGIVVRLPRVFDLRGRVVGGGSRRVVVRVVGVGLLAERRVAASGGEFLVAGLTAGSYELSAHTREPPWLASAVLTGVRVGGRDRARRRPVLRLEEAHALAGKVVRADDGAAVAGVRLTVRAARPELSTATATSGEGGAFRLPPLVRGDYLLDAWADGLLPLVGRSLTLPPGGDGALVLRLERGETLAGRIVGAGGAGIAGVVVRVHVRRGAGRAARRGVGELGVLPGPIPPIPRGDERAGAPASAPALWSAISGAEGRFALKGLPRGEVQLLAEHPQYEARRSDWLRLPHADELVLALRRGARLVGRVLDARGVPLPGARLRLRYSDGRTRLAIADDRGAFRFDRLSPGRVRVAARHGGYRPAHRDLRVRAARGHEVELLLRRARGLLSGRVLDGRRLPVAGATVRVRRGGHVLVARSAADGGFSIYGVGRRTVTVEVRHPAFVPLRRKVRADRPQELLLAPLGRLRGRVQHWRTGAPVRRFTLVLVDGGRPPVTVVDGDGLFAVRAPPGKWRLHVSAAGFASRRVAARVVDPRRGLPAGEVLVSLRPAGRIVGRVRAVSGRPVVGAAVSAGGISGRTDKEGRFSLKGVPEGVHVVQVRLRDGRALRSDPTTVRGGEQSGPVRFDLVR